MNFPATFCVGDFCASDLETSLPRQLSFHLVSCQFALHYSFSSEESALQLMRNVACRLQPGGVFVGTTTDANVLIKRLRAAPGLSFGNSHYSVVFDDAHASKSFPATRPFGIRYRFSLRVRGIETSKSDVMMSGICKSQSNHFVGTPSPLLLTPSPSP